MKKQTGTMNIPDFEDLLHRYFRGKLADEEYQQLVALLKDQQYKNLFNEKKRQWDQQPEWDENGRVSWRRLLYKIENQERAFTGKRNTVNLWPKIASWAAVLIIGLITGTMATWVIMQNRAVPEQMVVETARGQKSKTELPDGSKVWLNANSRLVVHAFTSRLREVELTGEAYFEVARKNRSRFMVKTNECDIEVKGTTFNVMAYDEFGRKEITLLEGKVNVVIGETVKELEPGNSLILKDRKVTIVKALPAQVTGWVENKFNFHRVPLPELMKRLEYWYDVDITLENRGGEEVTYTGTFKNEETIWQVLDAIQVYTPIQYEKTELRKIKITTGMMK